MNEICFSIRDNFYVDTDIELLIDIHYSYCPGTRSTPEYEEYYIKSIKHKNRKISEDVLLRYLQFIDGEEYVFDEFDSMVYQVFMKEAENHGDDGETMHYWNEHFKNID